MDLHLKVEKLSLTIKHSVYIANTVYLLFLMVLTTNTLFVSEI